MTRTCPDCGKTLELNSENFKQVGTSRVDGKGLFMSMCKECFNRSRRKYKDYKRNELNELLGDELVRHTVKCRNRCNTTKATFSVLLPKGEKPKDIYLCPSCKESGADRHDWDFWKMRPAKAWKPDTTECVSLKGEALERAKAECLHISKIPARRYL